MTSKTAPAPTAEEAALSDFIAATDAIAHLNEQRVTHTATRRAAVLTLQSLGWSIQRIADATGLSKAGIGQMAKSAQEASS